MSIQITDSAIECFENNDLLCMILAPAAFISVLAPPLAVLYILFQRQQKKGLVSNLVGLLYGCFAFHGIIVMKLAQASQSDKILFYIGLTVLIFFSIAFLADFLKKYSALSYWWKLSRFISGSILCALVITFSIPAFDYDFIYTFVLSWNVLCNFCMGGLIAIGIVKGSRKGIPYGLYISNVVAYALWNATIWLFVINNETEFKEETIPIVSILLVGFLLQFGYCVGYLFIEDKKSTYADSFAVSELGKKFGGNIRDETDIDSQQNSPKKGELIE